MTLYSWSWLFLVGYIAAMSIFGYLGSRRVGGADDFAVARAGYGPAVLALAFASTARQRGDVSGVARADLYLRHVHLVDRLSLSIGPLPGHPDFASERSAATATFPEPGRFPNTWANDTGRRRCAFPPPCSP